MLRPRCATLRSRRRAELSRHKLAFKTSVAYEDVYEAPPRLRRPRRDARLPDTSGRQAKEETCGVMITATADGGFSLHGTASPKRPRLLAGCCSAPMLRILALALVTSAVSIALCIGAYNGRPESPVFRGITFGLINLFAVPNSWNLWWNAFPGVVSRTLWLRWAVAIALGLTALRIWNISIGPVPSDAHQSPGNTSLFFKVGCGRWGRSSLSGSVARSAHSTGCCVCACAVACAIAGATRSSGMHSSR